MAGRLNSGAKNPRICFVSCRRRHGRADTAAAQTAREFPHAIVRCAVCLVLSFRFRLQGSLLTAHITPLLAKQNCGASTLHKGTGSPVSLPGIPARRTGPTQLIIPLKYPDCKGKKDVSHFAGCS